jgi:uncharacterized membrane protein
MLIHHQAMHVGPLPPPNQLADYEGVSPGAVQWIIGEATKNADHARTMEREALALQRLDMQLHRLLPFAVVLAFLAASFGLAFFNPIVGGVGLVGTMASVLIAYLTGRAPAGRSTEDQPPKSD